MSCGPQRTAVSNWGRRGLGGKGTWKIWAVSMSGTTSGEAQIEQQSGRAKGGGGGGLMFHLCFDGFHSARRRFLVSGIADGRDDDGGGGGGGPRTGSFDGLSAVRSATYVPACQW